MADQNTTASFVKSLQALWSVEKQLTEALPQMIQKATNLGLKKNLALHLAETDQHKEAIRGICTALDYPHEGEEAAGLKNILAEGEKTMATKSQGEELDAAIIEGCIKVEHYEIEQYTPLIAVAKDLGYKGFAARLALTLEEERQADAKLNFLQKYLVQKTAEAGAPNLALK